MMKTAEAFHRGGSSQFRDIRRRSVRHCTVQNDSNQHRARAGGEQQAVVATRAFEEIGQGIGAGRLEECEARGRGTPRPGAVSDPHANMR